MNKAKQPEIFATKDYKIFKGIVGNRKTYPGHVASLTSAIAKRNLLAENPIMVTKDLRVLDGQHRLEAAKNNNWTIYYTIVEEGTLEDVQMLNTSSMAWKAVDYMESYIALGKENYVMLKQYLEIYKMSLTNTALVLRGGNARYAGDWKLFKKGEFKIGDVEEADAIFQAIQGMKPYVAPRAWNDREFIASVMKIGKMVPYNEMIEKMDAFGERIEVRSTIREYLRQFEEIYNFGRKNHERFY